jgi:hypothetical protein
LLASRYSGTVVNQPLASLIGGSVEVLKAFLEVMGSPETATTTAVCQEPDFHPERWILVDQSSAEGCSLSKSRTEENDLSPDQIDRDSAIERLMNSITQKLTVDCPKLLEAGETAIQNARFASTEETSIFCLP